VQPSKWTVRRDLQSARCAITSAAHPVMSSAFSDRRLMQSGSSTSDLPLCSVCMKEPAPNTAREIKLSCMRMQQLVLHQFQTCCMCGSFAKLCMFMFMLFTQTPLAVYGA
jgi:hypothetical protein